jgi:hypothetical protein
MIKSDFELMENSRPFGSEFGLGVEALDHLSAPWAHLPRREFEPRLGFTVPEINFSMSGLRGSSDAP